MKGRDLVFMEGSGAFEISSGPFLFHGLWKRKYYKNSIKF